MADRETVAADELQPVIFGAGTVAEGGRRKLAALDGIRGLAVLTVMMSHFERFLPNAAAVAPLKTLFAYGWSGVDLFFVLSGFLITGILMQTKTSLNYFRSFYARRVLRIFPIYYATLVVVFAVIAIVPGIQNVPPADQRWTYFAYLENWIPLWTGAWPPNVLGHFWSLAVEEQFYLVWPLCVLLLTQRGVLRAAVALSLVALALRCIWVAHSGATPAVMLWTLPRMDSLLVGAIAAVFFARGQWKDGRMLTGICLTSLGAFAAGVVATAWGKEPAASFGFVSTIGYTLLAVGFGALVLGAAYGDGRPGLVQRVFRERWLSLVGKYSYGMYVYHVPLLGICELVIYRHLPQALRDDPAFGLAYVAFLTVGTYAVAAISFRFVEAPILRLKRHFEPLFAKDDPVVSNRAQRE